MRLFLRYLVIDLLIFGLVIHVLPPTLSYADTCGIGLGEPPFLSFGVRSNLLLMIDNSGSMLDMAYVANTGECVDNSYASGTQYAGNYTADKWYKWTEGVQPWKSGATYAVGDIVYTEGVFYKATAATGSPSTGVEIGFDSEVTWTSVYTIDVWRHSEVYPAKSFVQFDGQLFYTVAGGTASDSDLTNGLSIYEDTGVTWVSVDSTWRNTTAYSVNDIVSDGGMLFKATSSGTSNGTGVWDDAGVNWVRLDEGYFEETAYASSADAATAFAAQPGAASSHTDLFVKIVSVNDGTSDVQSRVSAFAAKGNFLNWASSSKFDIQKKILTGGKFDEDAQRLISQNRGCADHGFFKEVTMSDGKVLTLSIQGASEENWIDSTDDTTRISILALSASSFIASDQYQACQDALTELQQDVVNQGALKQDITDCLDYGGTNNIMAESNAAYNHALHDCWYYSKHGSFPVGITDVKTSCEHIYDHDIPPATITTESSGYICTGDYIIGIPDDLRDGYIGRCWEPATIPAGCAPVSCGPPVGTIGDPRCGTDGYLYECSGNYNSNKDECNKAWVLVLVDADGAGPGTCTAADIAAAAPAHWTDDLNPNTADACIQQAVEDYCGYMEIPEVIDPSDQIFDTGEFWSMPAVLIDSGVASFFGGDRSLIVMKGYKKQTTQPEGVLQGTAADLRIGVMAFNAVGALTECTTVDPSDAIQEYCPTDNKDGAKILAGIRLGTDVAASGPGSHIDYVVQQVNSIQATSWTPLAEAMYNAIGYYTQNTAMRLSVDDFDTTVNPITNWCQENHVLIITEGASTADINQDVIDFVNSAPIDDGDQVSDTKCTDGLDGSTYLDDLTYFAQHADASVLYPAGNSQLPSDDGTMYDKKNITTHIVVTGTLRDVGDTECSPDEIIEAAATNGGTELLVSANPSELESNLLEKFNELRQRASAGSAASVISSARGGEGAIYQAIFWPELKRQDNTGVEWAVDWVGDVHSLFIDQYGRMYEDSNSDRMMNPSEDVDGDGKLDNDEDVNANGIMDAGEDTDSDGHLDVYEDKDSDGVIDGDDKRVIIYFDTSANRSKGCYNTSIFYTGACTNSKELSAIKYLWSANDWLSRISNVVLSADASVPYGANDVFYNRNTYLSSEQRRYIFTWVDLNNDGDVDYATEVLPFVDRDGSGNAINWAGLGVSNRGLVAKDFSAADNDEVRQIIRWVRGADWTTEDIDGDGILDAGEDLDGDGHLDVFEDVNGNGILDAGEDVDGDGSLESPVRNRMIPAAEGSGTLSSWRLGDIIHSTPMTVAAPSEGFHLIYNDKSYAKFVSRYKNRRHMIYMGANDGMLHAVNGGFYSEKDNKFCLVSLNADGTCSDAAAAAPALGAEMWGYVPYNLLPHLKCLTEKDYAGAKHKYYVDLRPRLFDVKIFSEEAACTADYNDAACTHPQGWGTILVGGMRFGGAPVDAAADLGQPNTDNRQFISSYFILDITDPEKPPVLLGELTQTLSDSDGNLVPDSPNYVDLGFSTVVSTMSIMKDASVAPEVNKWYLILGSGPHGSDALKGVSDQDARISIVALNNLVDGNNLPVKSLRISAAAPVAGSPDGTFQLAGSPHGFVSDPITVDFDINPSMENYKSDAIYFGTVEGDFDATSSYWDGGGKMYRLVTRKLDLFGRSEYGTGASEPATEPYEWQIKTLIDLSSDVLDADGNPLHPAQPITASPSVGTDGKNFWVYFGTGRFFDANDKTDDTQQSYYGIKEPMTFVNPLDCTNSLRTFTWNEIELTASGAVPGEMGLLKVDEIEVHESTSPFTFVLSCVDGTTDCLPAGVVAAGGTYNILIDYFAGAYACTAAGYNGYADGWYRDFYPYTNRERNLGQGTLLGGLLTFTTYQPYEDTCLAEGLAYLYGVYYQTGTAWHQRIFGDYGIDILGNVEAKMSLGRGLAMTPSLYVGSGDEGDAGAGPKVFVQTSTGEIKEIQQQNLPFATKPGKYKWLEW
ncbi:MAG: hypothetical protein C4531_11670 [Desulfurivibrio sp.]|nr:MAG: hypothetical protein C4531_11670 [Desulfurivibrio sp.]